MSNVTFRKIDNMLLLYISRLSEEAWSQALAPTVLWRKYRYSLVTNNLNKIEWYDNLYPKLEKYKFKHEKELIARFEKLKSYTLEDDDIFINYSQLVGNKSNLVELNKLMRGIFAGKKRRKIRNSEQETNSENETSELLGEDCDIFRRIWMPFTPEELEIAKMNERKAHGFDRVGVREWQQHHPNEARVFFHNIMLSWMHFPWALLCGPTIFIPKKENSNVPQEQRPTTVGSVAHREFISMDASVQITFLVTITMFSKVDGISNCIYTLQGILHEAISSYLEVHICLLDINKAFHNVDYDKVIDIMKKNGAPIQSIEYFKHCHVNKTPVFQFAGLQFAS